MKTERDRERWEHHLEAGGDRLRHEDGGEGAVESGSFEWGEMRSLRCRMEALQRRESTETLGSDMPPSTPPPHLSVDDVSCVWVVLRLCPQVPDEAHNLVLPLRGLVRVRYNDLLSSRTVEWGYR